MLDFLPKRNVWSATFLPPPWVVVCLCIVVAGCASTRVEYFTDRSYPPRETGAPVEWLLAEPSRPHIEVARITLGSTMLSRDSLRHELLDHARRLGADAVIDETEGVAQSVAPTPYYEPGLLGPWGAAFGLYGYGWYSPYSSNPYVLSQGAVDQPRRERYLSAVAIRYGDARDQ